jgi:hypothetical protein
MLPLREGSKAPQHGVRECRAGADKEPPLRCRSYPHAAKPTGRREAGTSGQVGRAVSNRQLQCMLRIGAHASSGHPVGQSWRSSRRLAFRHWRGNHKPGQKRLFLGVGWLRLPDANGRADANSKGFSGFSERGSCAERDGRSDAIRRKQGGSAEVKFDQVRQRSRIQRQSAFLGRCQHPVR